MKTILFLAANPKNTSRLRLDEEIREIGEALRRANKRQQYKLETTWAVRSRDFYQAILAYQPNIVHFSGHSVGEHGIVLEDDTGKMAQIQTNALASMFKLFAKKGVECVVLNACYLKVQAEAINQYVKYVVGMNKAVGDKAAVTFAVAFYDAIFAGYEVEEAYELGCASISLEGIPEVLTPVMLRRKSNLQKLTIKRQKQQFRGYREYIDGIPLEMVLIPDGIFTMGAPEQEEGSRNSERPQHDVKLSSFLMGRYPITQAQWKAIASRTDLKINQDLDPDPSRFKEPYQDIDRWQRPVEQVSWYDAVEFCQRLSRLTGREYTLPSEAQWEYACRGVRKPLKTGKSYPPFNFGETITTDLANFNGASYTEGPKGENRGQTTPVGYFEVVNSFGLSDMHGNVWEWCLDDWHGNYDRAHTDGSAWFDNNNSLAKKKGNPVLRGGSWFVIPDGCRSATRNNYIGRNFRDYVIGFRVVCESGRT